MESDEHWRAVVVDDDADTRYLLRHALQATGVVEVVAEAADGEEAVTMTEATQPDLVLMDLNMPRCDGLTALPAVRAVCAPDTVVIVMSAVGTPAAKEAVREGTAAAFLEKDPGFKQLVSDLLELARRTGPGTAQGTQPVEWHLPADLTSGAKARKLLRELLANWRLDQLLDEAELLTTELVNNAIVHADSDVRLTIRRRRRTVRFEVTDEGWGTLHRSPVELEATNGRGLMLVDAMSQDWGTAIAGEEKTVWFELEATP